MVRFLIKSAHRAKAFTLVELVVTLALTTLLSLSSIIYFASVGRTITRPVVVYNDQNYALAPIIRDTPDQVAKTDLFDALDLQVELAKQVDAADFVAVFGGANPDPGAPAPLLPLATNFAATSLPSLLNISPAALTTTNHIAAAAAADLLGHYETSADNSDFTLVAFRGVSEICAIAQVRRHPTTNNGVPLALYETTLLARTPPSATWTSFGYRFYLPAAEDNWSVPAGAKHAWFRATTGWWSRQEEVGTTVAFPDPYVLANPTPGATVLSHSRFTYFVSASPAF